MKRYAMVLGLLGFVVTFALYFVWVPDIWRKSESIVGETSISDGHQLRVTQIWNNVDFYSTYLTYAGPDGKERVYVLDADDIKRWSCKFVTDESAGNVQIMMGDKKVGTFDWKHQSFKNRNGAIAEAITKEERK